MIFLFLFAEVKAVTFDVVILRSILLVYSNLLTRLIFPFYIANCIGSQSSDVLILRLTFRSIKSYRRNKLSLKHT